jgi:hypothetical protein
MESILVCLFSHTSQLTLYFALLVLSRTAVSKDFSHQAHACQEAATEPAFAAMDPYANGQHYQVERPASSLASYQVGYVNMLDKAVGYPIGNKEWSAILRR